MGEFLPYGRQSITDTDIEAVISVLKQDLITSGPMVETFEQSLQQHIKAKHIMACSNGTAALHLASMALGLGEGDVVIVPAISFVATANAPAMTGATIVFSDVDPLTGHMRPQDLEKAIATGKKLGRLRAVFPVHLNGLCCDMAALAAIAKNHDLAIVEDACHALGGVQRSQDGQEFPVGACHYSSLSCFSFHPVKTIATGEGGAVATNDPNLAKKIRLLRNHGIERNAKYWTQKPVSTAQDNAPIPWYYEMQNLGYNYRICDILCALGTSQLKRLGEIIAKRQQLVESYHQQILARKLPLRSISQPQTYKVGWHLFVVGIDFRALGLSRGQVMQALKNKNIGTQVHYIPIPWQPYWQKKHASSDAADILPDARSGNWLGARDYYDQCLSLPLYPSMQDRDVTYVIDQLAALLPI